MTMTRSFIGSLTGVALALATVATAHATTYEWGFSAGNLNADLGPGTMAYAGATAGYTTFGTTDGSSVPHIAGSPATYMRFPQWPTPAANDPTLGYLLNFAGSGPNGSGGYINRYTFILDVLVPGPLNWTPFFNTDPANGNDADWYLASDGSLGIGALGYTAAGVIQGNTWYRIGFTADLGAGDVRYYVNGARVFTRTGASLLDGRFSLYSNLDAGPDLLLANENDTSGNYTRPQVYSAVAFVDQTLSDADFAALGGPNATGIYVVPEPGTLALLGLGGLVFLLRRRS
jgi:hypothetical protein